jgi:uncharacterized protein (TIGR02679 family)
MERVRSRVERGASPASGTVSLRDATESERDGIARLFGRKLSRANTLTVDLGELDALIRDSGAATSLAEAIETLWGPIRNLRGDQLALAQRWSAVFDEFVQSNSHDSIRVAWLEELRSSGFLRRIVRQDPVAGCRLLESALNVIDHLPASDTHLAELAARTANDSHALDPGELLSSLALRYIARLDGDQADVETPDGRRSAWASVGVICDELSAPVLCLNLSTTGNSVTERALRLHSEAGEPYRLSVRQLMRDPLSFARIPAAFIVENPVVIAACASRLGPACAPLICIEGQPKTAARLLLTQLSAAGVPLRYHGDFDWPGITIGNLIMARHGATPWRFSTSDYVPSPTGRPLEGVPIEASWDPDLRAAMEAKAIALHEERVLEVLLPDLRRLDL